MPTAPTPPPRPPRWPRAGRPGDGLPVGTRSDAGRLPGARPGAGGVDPGRAATGFPERPTGTAGGPADRGGNVPVPRERGTDPGLPRTALPGLAASAGAGRRGVPPANERATAPRGERTGATPGPTGRPAAGTRATARDNGSGRPTPGDGGAPQVPAGPPRSTEPSRANGTPRQPERPHRPGTAADRAEDGARPEARRRAEDHNPSRRPAAVRNRRPDGDPATAAVRGAPDRGTPPAAEPGPARPAGSPAAESAARRRPGGATTDDGRAPADRGRRRTPGDETPGERPPGERTGPRRPDTGRARSTARTDGPRAAEAATTEARHPRSRRPAARGAAPTSSGTPDPGTPNPGRRSPGSRTDRDAREGRGPRRAPGPGWWQTPTSRRAGDTGPRRTDDAAESDGGRTGRRRAARRRTPAEMLRGLRRSSSQHLRPLSPEERRIRRRRRIRWSIIGGVATVVLAPVLLFVIGYLIFSVPTPDEAVNNQVAVVSYADGSQLARLVPEQGNRVKVPIDRVPLQVRQAVLAAEDRTFYSNPGFDVTGILRAAWNQLRGGAGGGSTISQQYVKTTLVGDQATLFRKWKEMIVSVKINQERSKDEILDDYLNAIYFGRGAYGIQAASQAYFGKDVDRLGVAEGALLAGVIQSPSRWDPAIDPTNSLRRWQFVMDGMASQGWITPQERAQATFPQTVPRKIVSGSVPTDSSGHIVNAVRDELGSLGISDQEFSQEGLQITTTIDPTRQKQAVDAAHAGLAGQPADLRSAVVAIDPATGGIMAYYGGDNGVGLDYAQVRKQPGSTFKPFVVLAALMQDPPVGLGEVFSGEPVPGLRNADGADCRRCDVKQAMTISNNVVFTQLAQKVGPQNVADAARAAGITSPLNDPDSRLALGNKEVTPVELASAYATIADGGVYHVPHLISKVVTSDGRVLYQSRSSDGERRFPEQVARNVTEAMLDVASNDGLTLPGVRQVASKTGTVQSHIDGQNNDAWMSGFTPDVATTVWIGTDMNSPIRTANGTPISGGTVPGEVWRNFMVDTAKAQPPPTFAPYRPIGEPPSDKPPGVDPDAPAGTTALPTATPTPTASAPPPTTDAPPAAADPRAASAEPPAGSAAAPSTTAEPSPTTPSTCTLAHPCG
ncbi:hypothetical protein PSD17_53990 [Pseudonocardia sp. D17]|nr:hypothetical protein PSD17_53990 [Pseudonocardia sp. D17]